MPIFTHEPNGAPRAKNKYIMGRRNWCAMHWDNTTGDLVFDLRVEKEKGVGTSVGLVIDSFFHLIRTTDGFQVYGASATATVGAKHMRTS